jgi:hypothetical protein
MLHDVETWSPALKKDHVLKIFENSRLIKRLFKSDE